MTRGWSFRARLAVTLVVFQALFGLAVLPWYFWSSLQTGKALQSQSLEPGIETLWTAARNLDSAVPQLHDNADWKSLTGALEGIRRQESANQSLQIDAQVVGFRTLILLSFFQLLGLLVLGLLVARALSRQVIQLHSAVTRLASGDRSGRLPPQRGLEFQALGSEFNRLLDNLDDQERRLTELSKLQGWQETAKFLSHQIKNPLTSLGLATRNLEEMGVLSTPVAKQNAGILREEADKLLHLVNRLKELTGFGELRRQSVDLAALADAVAQRSMPNTLTLEWTGIRPFLVMGDRLLLEQVLLNLCLNASEAAEGEVTILIHAEKNRVWFQDSLTGLDPALPQKLFQPPFTTKASGTGLGLTFCRRILQLHGGDLSADLNPQGGLRLLLTFPEARDDDSGR